jgi:hypothetical protein
VTCPDPAAILVFLRGKASDRKLRLFACGCCRRGWDRITAPGIKELVETVEQYVDRPTTEREWLELFHSVSSMYFTAYAAWPDAWKAALTVGHGWLSLEGRRRQVRHRQEAAAQCALLRDLFGGFFFRPVLISPAVLAGKDSTVVKMAQSIYDNRQWSDIPLLGDALEEAGCDDQVVLDHCRGPGPHARGCHVVDAILEKT